MKIYMNRYTTAYLTLITCILLLVGSTLAITDTASTTATLTVNEFLSVTLSDAPIIFSGADPLETVNAASGNGYPLTATIGLESNVGSIDIKIKADGADLCTDYPTCVGDTLAVGNMEWSDASAGTYTPYTTLDATVCSGLSTGGVCDIYHKLTVPGAQMSGSYSVGITVTAMT